LKKASYPSIIGLKASQKRAEKLCNDALSILTKLPYDTTNLILLSNYIVLRNKLWENFQPPIDLKDDNNKFKSHLTLARIKWLDDREVLNNLLNRYQRISFPEMQVDRIIYYESKLSESGPTYYKIGSYFLK